MGSSGAYRCEATSVEGFIQQLAVSYVKNGYYFYVTGNIREGRDPREIDRRIIGRYDIDVSKFTRARRKRAGSANIHYIRHERFFVIIATAGKHLFREREAKRIRDVRDIPIVYEGYAVSFRGGRACVRIDRGTELNTTAYFEEFATRLSAAVISHQFWRLPFQPYAPVRQQLLGILRKVNRLRRAAGLEKVPVTAVRWKRRIVKPFGEGGFADRSGPSDDGDSPTVPPALPYSAPARGRDEF